MTGEVIDAARAKTMGLVTEVVAHGRLLDRTVELATQVCEVLRRRPIAASRHAHLAGGGRLLWGPPVQTSARCEGNDDGVLLVFRGDARRQNLTALRNRVFRSSRATSSATHTCSYP
jgi:enoyl-CoA hydratase/carnithine racemase